MPQTNAQRKAALDAAGLDPTQQAGVVAGKGYTPAAPETPVTTPVARTIDPDPNVAAAENFQDTFTAPKTAEQIAEDMRKSSQGTIDAINKTYDDQLAQQQTTNNQRLDETNAVSVLAGLSGSTEAGRKRDTTVALNDKETAAINNKRALDLANVYSKISDQARAEARTQLEDARLNASDIMARQKERQTDAINSIKTMAAGGLVDFDTFKDSPQSQEVYQYALKSAGGSEDALRAMFALNRPQDQIVGTPTRIGDKYVQAYQNPITGKISYENIPLPFDLPPEYTSFQKMGDNLVAFPSNWDGDVNKLKTIVGSPSAEDALRIQGLRLDNAKKAADLNGGQPGDNPQLYSGLSTSTATAVRARVNAFKSEPMVQNFATVQDGYNFASSLAADTKNPADDQALIYALAKALDPGSVVREGEYATAQKYAQSWVSAYGAGVNQALLGTGFLSDAARSNIKKTIEQKYTTTKKSYDNLYKQYGDNIGALTGRDDGTRFLTDYSTNQSDSSASDIKTLAAQKGVSETDLQDSINQYGEDAVREFLSQ